MYVAHEKRGDLLVVRFRDRVGHEYAVEHPGDRFVESDDAGVVAIEFLHASEGIDPAGLPEANAIVRALRQLSALMGSSVRIPSAQGLRHPT